MDLVLDGKDALGGKVHLHGHLSTFTVIDIEGNKESSHLMLRVEPKDMTREDMLAIAHALILPGLAEGEFKSMIVDVLEHHLRMDLVHNACDPATDLEKWLEQVDSLLAANRDGHPCRHNRVMQNLLWLALADLQLHLSKGRKNYQQFLADIGEGGPFANIALAPPATRKRPRCASDDGGDRPAKRC